MAVIERNGDCSQSDCVSDDAWIPAVFSWGFGLDSFTGSRTDVAGTNRQTRINARLSAVDGVLRFGRAEGPATLCMRTGSIIPVFGARFETAHPVCFNLSDCDCDVLIRVCADLCLICVGSVGCRFSLPTGKQNAKTISKHDKKFLDKLYLAKLKKAHDTAFVSYARRVLLSVACVSHDSARPSLSVCG